VYPGGLYDRTMRPSTAMNIMSGGFFIDLSSNKIK
jgi:hypothetical protein